MADKRLEHLTRFYSLLDRLEAASPARCLSGCSGRMEWPARAVYFFREAGELRSHTGQGPRIVRVGTHALKAGSGTRLWNRLSQHKGRTAGSGNHKGSIFRLIVGASLIRRYGHVFPTWGQGNTASRDVRSGERAVECEVSAVIGQMPFLWIAVDDEAGPLSQRGFIERNAIALLSNYNKPPLDPPSEGWLGRDCNRERVRNSGLWNSNHVDECYDPAFLDEMERLVSAAGGTA